MNIKHINFCEEFADVAEIDNVEISGGEWAGTLISFAGTRSDGYLDPLLDKDLFIPDDHGENIAERWNDGWHFGGVVDELTSDDLAEIVATHEQELDDDGVFEAVQKICAATDIEIDPFPDSLADRLPCGCHNPMLVWTPGDYSSVRVVSALTYTPTAGECYAENFDYLIFGDDGTPNWWCGPMTDEEYKALLDVTIFAQ